MSRYFLSAHAFACIVDEHAVFLDLKRDRYTAIEPQHVHALRELIRGWPGASVCSEPSEVLGKGGDVPALLESLLEEGLLTDDESIGKTAVLVGSEPATATIDDVRGSFPRIDWRDLSNFIKSWLLATLLLKSVPLRAIVRRVEQRKNQRRNTVGCFDVLKAQRLMTAYYILRPNFFSAKDACLRDSLTFVEFFARNEMYPTWMFGVRMKPFRAHSWVQEGDMVLNDYVPHVSKFVPILAV
jgi:hypothetical protein